MDNKCNNEKRTLREEWRMFRRAIGIIHREVPGFWRYQILSIFANTFSPYFGLFMSAQMINELAGECDIRKLLLLAAITVIGGFVISVISRFLQGRNDLVANCILRSLTAGFTE